MKSFHRTMWEPSPDAAKEKPNAACSLYHCPQCGIVMRPTPLTIREVEILRAYAEGLTTNEIAALKFVDQKTIESHRAKILLKTGAPNMVRAVVLGIKQGVIIL